MARFKNVLLIDDVLTTGATFDSCVNALKSRGANKIYIATVAIGAYNK